MVIKRSSVQRNIIANYAGQGWTGLMGLVFIPFYIRYLGIEAYGLIGLFAAMQAWLALLDMGMTPTLNREMALFTAGAHTAESISDLLRTLEIMIYSIAAVIGVMLWGASGYIARDWLHAAHLSPDTVANALSVIAFVIAFRFIEGLYRGSLYGLQKQVWYNVASALLATCRHAGAVAVLAFVSPTLHAFFLWQGLISVVSVAAFAVSVHRSLPRPPRQPRFSLNALAKVWRFAAGLMGITLLSILLTQVDKIVLSKLLSLENFGYYTLAGTVSGILYMMLGPISQALYPRMVELFAAREEAALASVYHTGAQLITVLTAPIVCVLFLYARATLFVWSGDAAVADRAAPLVAALVLGTFLNGVMWMPYQLQLAHGWAALTFKANAVAVAVLVPAILWVVPRQGAIGAAWLWVLLNTGYVTFVLHFMHKRVLPTEKWRWYVSDLFLPSAGPAAVGVMMWAFKPSAAQGRLPWFIFLGITGVLATAASVLLADRVRNAVFSKTGLVRRESDSIGG